MTFLPGNKLAVGGRKEKPFRDALRMELAALGDDDPRALRGLARKLLATAADEEGIVALKELADRIDGKVPQGIENGEDGPLELIHRIERIIVHPENRDG